MNKFKKSDKVRVTSKRLGGSWECVPHIMKMIDQPEKELTIMDEIQVGYYSVAENSWCWCEDMLEFVDEKSLKIKNICLRLTNYNTIRLAILIVQAKMVVSDSLIQDARSFAKICSLRFRTYHDVYPDVIRAIKANPSVEQSIISYALNLLKNQL